MRKPVCRACLCSQGYNVFLACMFAGSVWEAMLASLLILQLQLLGVDECLLVWDVLGWA